MASWEEWQWRGRYEKDARLWSLWVILIRDSVRNIPKSSNAVLRRWGGNKWTAYGEQERLVWQGFGRARALVKCLLCRLASRRILRMIGKGWMSSAEWPFWLLDLRFEILPIKKKLCKFDFANEEDVEWDMPVGKSDGSQGLWASGPLDMSAVDLVDNSGLLLLQLGHSHQCPPAQAWRIALLVTSARQSQLNSFCHAPHWLCQVNSPRCWVCLNVWYPSISFHIS